MFFEPIGTRRRQNDFVFPVRHILLRFISLNLIFSEPISRIYPSFVEKKLRSVDDVSYSEFPVANYFISATYQGKKLYF